MSPNIENLEAHALAARLARLLGMADAIAERLTPEQKAFDIGVELYEARGLPK